MRGLLVALICTALWTGTGLAVDYNTIAPEELKGSIDAGEETLVVDICVEEMYREGHVPGSIPTYAYPVKSDEDREKLAEILPQIQESSGPVVIVCPRGAGGARRAYEYYRDVGVPEERLRILEGGLGGWPYPKVKD